LGFELGEDIPNPNLQELARHVLLRVRNVVIAIRKDPHPNESPGSCRSEIAGREGGSAGVRLIEDSECKGMYGPEDGIGAGRTQVAWIFVQEGAGQKLAGESGRVVCQPVSVIPAECASAVLPFLRILARRIEHAESRSKGSQDDGWWTVGFVRIYLKFILN
jgi:hypothetical protein